MPYAIECRKITKAFGSKVLANDEIDLNLNYGEILALLGENGSGKTTLMNMLSGIYHPDSGQIFVNGEHVSINSPSDAKALGIGMIHQHFKLVESFSACENIIISSHDNAVNKNDVKQRILKLCDDIGLKIDPDRRVSDMSVSEKQTTEILKVLYSGAKILILDEPTAVLTPQEIEFLFKMLRRMKEQGCAIIIITHKLAEVLEISDRVTLLRKGRSVATVKTCDTTPQQLTELLVGRAVQLEISRPEPEKVSEMLKIVDLTIEDAGIKMIDDISFELNSGEILGVAGIAGSGQKELCECIAGLLPASKGAVLYKKENILGKEPIEILNLGISMSFVPEDRLGMGLVPSMDIVQNSMLKDYRKANGPFIDNKPAVELANRLVDELSIVTPSIYTAVRKLSGGNVQKVLLGREIASSPNVLITAYPVRGLDINSSYLIYDLLNQQKEKGVAVMFIGEDLDVLCALSDRIMVLCHGKITGIVDAKKVTKEQLGLMMTGMAMEEAMA
ncbi:MAG: ABC transporter ATP-binding protein [Clostridia bacterium]|nr:ABC transporter ATP-binding protein [Clostridia bacterium]